MKRMIFLVALLFVLAPAISPAAVIVPAGGESGATLSMEWGTYENGAWAFGGDCLAEGMTEITVAKETVYFLCDAEGLETASFRLYSNENGVKRLMQQRNQELYIKRDNVCAYNFGESCENSKDCTCPDGYFCYLDGPCGSYTAEDFEALRIDADLSLAGQGCLPDSLEAVYGSAGSGEQISFVEVVGGCGYNKCGKYLIDNENCRPYEICIDDDTSGRYCTYNEDCADESLRESDIDFPDNFDWKCDGGTNKDLGCNSFLEDMTIPNAIQVCDPDPLIRAAVYYWILSDTLIKEQVENGLYDDAMIKIFDKALEISDEYGSLPMKGGCADITPDSLITGNVDKNPVCTHMSAFMLSMARTLGVPQERVFEIGFGTTVYLGGHSVIAYESDEGKWRFFDATCCREWATEDDWHTICIDCDCITYIAEYQNDYGSHWWLRDEEDKFGGVCKGLPESTEFWDNREK